MECTIDIPMNLPQTWIGQLKEEVVLVQGRLEREDCLLDGGLVVLMMQQKGFQESLVELQQQNPLFQQQSLLH